MGSPRVWDEGTGRGCPPRSCVGLSACLRVVVENPWEGRDWHHARIGTKHISAGTL